jgi:hypothetical protein
MNATDMTVDPSGVRDRLPTIPATAVDELVQRQRGGVRALDRGVPAEDNAADENEMDRAARSPGPSSGGRGVESGTIRDRAVASRGGGACPL